MRPSIKTYRDSHYYTVYFAPRGKQRMLRLGSDLAQRHLKPEDKLIGIIGEPGAGKSILVKGMFPGVELSNDDMGVNVRPLPLLSSGEKTGFFESHTYHIDMRFEMAFTSIGVLANAIQTALENDKRVIVEHFDLLYQHFKMNAELLIGLGEEIIVTRPGFFGPEPTEIAKIVFESQKYRKMAHTAENITELFLAEKGTFNYMHSDVQRGFVLEFEDKPAIDLKELEQNVKEYIAKDIAVSFYDETHIKFGDTLHHCTGPRIHVKSTSEIEHFELMPDFLYDPMRRTYLLVGNILQKPSDCFSL